MDKAKIINSEFRKERWAVAAVLKTAIRPGSVKSKPILTITH